MFEQREACCSPWILFLSLASLGSYVCFVFWLKHIMWFLLSAEMMWDAMLKLLGLIFNFIADNMCCFIFCLYQEPVFLAIINPYLLFFFNHCLLSNLLYSVVSLVLSNSRFDGMQAVASLGVGVSVGRERVKCTIDSSCDFSYLDFQERIRIVLISYVRLNFICFFSWD